MPNTLLSLSINARGLAHVPGSTSRTSKFINDRGFERHRNGVLVLKKVFFLIWKEVKTSLMFKSLQKRVNKLFILD
mgnify:CR=1 FL=1